MSEFIRARSDKQKEQRMTEIKQATDTLFAARPYHEITLAAIAEQLGWSRAALYKYVTTKEDIFLEICADKQDAYTADLLAAYPAGSTYSPAVLAEVWTEQLVSHRDYFRYCDLLFTIIETNCTVERLAAFKTRYYAGQDALVERFARTLSADAACIGRLLNAVYYHAVGITGWCQENTLVMQAIDLAGLERRTVDFRDEMRDFIGMCLTHYAGASAASA